MGSLITQDDMSFFMYMVGSPKSTNYKHSFFQRKPYYKILDNKESEEFKRFIKVFNAQKHVLNDREKQILEKVYGIGEPRCTLKQVGILHNVKSERAKQIRNNAERKIVTNLLKEWRNNN